MPVDGHRLRPFDYANIVAGRSASTLIFLGSIGLYFQFYFKANRNPYYFAAFAIGSYMAAPAYG